MHGISTSSGPRRVTPFAEDREPAEIIPGLRREWLLILRRRRLIGVLIALSLGMAALYNHTVRPVYESVALVSAEESIPSQPYARLNRDLPRLGNVIAKEIARITSREHAATVVKSLPPAGQAELATGPLETWLRRLRAGLSEGGVASGSRDTAQAVAALRSRLRVSARENSTWIEIRVLAYDPQAAAELSNAVALLYVRETEAGNRHVIEELRMAMEAQIAGKQQQLSEELIGLRELGTEVGQSELQARKATIERQIRSFEEALVAARTTRVGRTATNREAARMSRGGALSSGDPGIQAAVLRISELEDRETALLATLGARHPDVVTNREQLNAARRRLESLAASAERAARMAYELALNEESRIAANLERLQQELAGLEQEPLSYTMIQKKTEASRLAVEQLMRTQETAAPILVEAVLVQTATPSPSPSSPRTRQNLLYALGGGIAAGLLLTWLLHRFDDSIQSPDDVREILNLPFLGVVPKIDLLGRQGLLAALGDNQAGFPDGLRGVRTNLIFGAPQVKPKVLLFTSASPGDGKSTVASGIAVLLHETKARVLLIDADLRRPTLHGVFGLRPGFGAGLSGLLSGRGGADLPELHLLAPGFEILVAGRPINASAAQLGSDKMRSLIAQARQNYDWVIIDSPPSLALPDASVLATMVDGVVVVCSGDKTPRQALKHVTDQLGAVGAAILGVVLNRVDMRRHAYYYGRYYSAYYSKEETGVKLPRAARVAQPTRTLSPQRVRG